MINQEKAQAALIRAKSGNSIINYSKVISGFIAKGVNAAEIMPRENVLTYAAWPALGRQVKRGEHGVKVITWVDYEKDGEKKKFPSKSTVFHISQTEPIKEAQ